MKKSIISWITTIRGIWECLMKHTHIPVRINVNGKKQIFCSRCGKPLGKNHDKI